MNECCRWGFLSTAGIGKKNWQAIKLAGNARLVAVASRSLDSARDFITACQRSAPVEELPIALGSYEELIERDDLDAVYIPLPTGIRKEWVLKAAAAGKHVICEKPCAVDAAELKTMIDACRDNNVQFMDGVMLMHTERLARMRPVVDNEIGDLRRIHSHLSFPSDSEFERTNIRMCSRLEPHGCLGDLGWYNIRIALWAMNWELPTQVTGRMINKLKRSDSDEAVPVAFAGELFFESGVTASFYCSFQSHHQQDVTFSGTDGLVRVPDFVLPIADRKLRFEVVKADFQQEECNFEMIPVTHEVITDEDPNSSPTAQETRLFRRFSEIVNSRKLDTFWPEVALKTQLVLDSCFHSANNGSASITTTPAR